MNQNKTTSSCCNAEIKRISRANYVCSKCSKDVSLELFFIWDLRDREI